jgi:hypothetical protein
MLAASFAAILLAVTLTSVSCAVHDLKKEIATLKAPREELCGGVKFWTPPVNIFSPTHEELSESTYKPVDAATNQWRLKAREKLDDIIYAYADGYSTSIGPGGWKKKKELGLTYTVDLTDCSKAYALKDAVDALLTSHEKDGFHQQQAHSTVFDYRKSAIASPTPSSPRLIQRPQSQ